MEQIIDYTDHVESAIYDAVVVQGKGKNVLILRKLERPIKRVDGKNAGYELECRWLSETCKSENDQAWACVQGQDYTYWQRKEIADVLKSKRLFEKFNLWG